MIPNFKCCIVFTNDCVYIVFHDRYHGGWAAPGFYFLGYGGVINIGGLRIGGMSGIYKQYDYEKGHYEMIPLNEQQKKSIYHIRHYDVYKMLQIKEPMDIFLSHDWPLGIERYGNTAELIRKKSYFRGEVSLNYMKIGVLLFSIQLLSVGDRPT